QRPREIDEAEGQADAGQSLDARKGPGIEAVSAQCQGRQCLGEAPDDIAPCQRDANAEQRDAGAVVLGIEKRQREDRAADDQKAESERAHRRPAAQARPSKWRMPSTRRPTGPWPPPSKTTSPVRPTAQRSLSLSCRPASWTATW